MVVSADQMAEQQDPILGGRPSANIDSDGFREMPIAG
jgi:hypothetical protein